MAAKLTDKQRTFVAEYLVDLNATQAAIRAGYSAKTANEQGARLLTNVSVAAAIAEAQAERAKKTQRTALDVLKDIQAVSKEAWRDGDLKTALKGFELEGKHLGMFTEKHEHTGRDGKPIEVDCQVSPAVEAMLNTLKDLAQ